MPRDDWAKARRKDAAKRGRRDKTNRSRPKKKPVLVKIYTIPAGTQCHVRAAGQKDWREHKTKKAVMSVGYIWKNERTHGFLWGGWEIKVPNEVVQGW
jgi:hypothetical protein